MACIGLTFAFMSVLIRQNKNGISRLAYTPKRIVSLVPSLTELLFDLGLENEVVGITKFCIHPNEWFGTKKRVGGTKDFKPDMIRELQPDLIIANKEENQQDGIEELAREFTVFLTEIVDMDTANQAILDIGCLTGREKEARRLVKEIEEEKEAFLPYISPDNDVLYLIWRKPYMSVGGDTFISSMLQEAGYENVLQDKTRYPSLESEEIRDLSPSWIFLSSEPFPFKEKHIKELEGICPDSRVVLVDGEMFSWYGSRLLKAFPYFSTLNRKF